MLLLVSRFQLIIQAKDTAPLRHGSETEEGGVVPCLTKRGNYPLLEGMAVSRRGFDHLTRLSGWQTPQGRLPARPALVAVL